MKLLVFLAKGFETIEFSAFIDVMGWAKTDFDCKIDVVTCGLNQKVVSIPEVVHYMPPHRIRILQIRRVSQARHIHLQTLHP